MRSIGISARIAIPIVRTMFSDHQWENLLPDHCDKCNRWYNAKMPHICEPDLLDPVTERNKLRRWLGEGVTLHDNL